MPNPTYSVPRAIPQRQRSRRSPTERFNAIGWSTTDRGCWEWNGARLASGGYGSFRAHGRSVRAHRFAYELFVGPIPDGAMVRHKCDNPPCVNPEHLEIGTHQQNMWDMSDRERSRAYYTGRYGGVCAKGLHDVTAPGSLRCATRKDTGRVVVFCVACDRERAARYRGPSMKSLLRDVLTAWVEVDDVDSIEAVAPRLAAAIERAMADAGDHLEVTPAFEATSDPKSDAAGLER